MMNAGASITFAWPELPDYAAKCIRAVIDAGCKVDVVATVPSVPIMGMEQSLGQAVNWISDPQPPASFAALGLQIPDILFLGGIRIPAFGLLEIEARQQGKPIILMNDTNWKGSLRNWIIDPVRHRLLINHRFDGVLVPGRSGARLARHCGFPSARVAQGLYGADPALFRSGPALADREKRFLYVGQFIERKNVLALARAFVRFVQDYPGWTLEMCGSGPLQDAIPDHPAIVTRGFVQPGELSALLATARCLVLPSHVEHWGLVVHEAALTGCALALSDTIGAADDLASPINAVTFPSRDEAAIYKALAQMAEWSDSQWCDAGMHSQSLAKQFGPTHFAKSVSMFAEKARPTS